MRGTLQELANAGKPTSLGAANLIEAGLPPTTRIAELSAGGVTRTLAEAFAIEELVLSCERLEVEVG